MVNFSPTTVASYMVATRLAALANYELSEDIAIAIMQLMCI